MDEEFYEEGAEIIGVGDVVEQIFFIVSGQVELNFDDRTSDKPVLETLQ